MSPDAPAAADVLPPGPPLPPAKPGPAFLFAYGVYAVDDGGAIATLDRKDTLFSQMTLDRDGRAWVSEHALADAHATLVIHDDARRRVVKSWTDQTISALAPAKSGGVWVVGEGFVGHAGRDQPFSTIALPTDIDAVDVLDEGEVLWVTTTTGLARYTVATRRWDIVREGKRSREVFRAGGMLWTLEDGAPDQLAGFDGKTWVEFALPDGISTLDSVAVAPDDRVYVSLRPPLSVGPSSLGVFDVVGGKPRWLATHLGGLHDVFIEAIDARGRLWCQRDGSLLVLARDGTPLLDAPPGTLRGMAGSTIKTVRVVGAGPTVLPPLAPRQTATIRGTIVARGTKEPLSNLAVDVCSVSCRLAGEARFRIVTDAKGRFENADVPIVDYPGAGPVGGEGQSGFNVVFEHAGKQSECCLAAQPGKVLDLGVLEYSW